MDFREKLVEVLADKTALTREQVEDMLEVPPDPKLGNYAFPCFRLKGAGSPKEKAEKLYEKMIRPDFISRIETVGPYVNFYLDQHVMAEHVLNEIYKQGKFYGTQEIGKEKKVVIDYSSPNIAKPFGIGHLRSTVIGKCLYNVFDALGYQPFGVNHLGDWGTQFGKLITAYKKWGNEEELLKDPIKYLLKLYVQFHKEAEHDESLIEAGREEFKKLEEGDKDALKLWELFKEMSLEEFRKIYAVLDVQFDSFNGEAFYNTQLNGAIEFVEQNTKTELSQGALIVNLEKFNMTPVLLRKSNGTTTYHTRDIAAALYRLKKYNPERLLYVVGMEQKLHFRQLFKTLELCKLPAEKFVHVDFGHFRFPEGKMSTRKGNVIFLEEVLDKAVALAQKIIEEKNPNLQNKEDVAKMVGIGAIVFADLSSDRVRNIDFNWEKMLSFEGETAPYIQYTHARACSILRKAGEEQNLRVTSHVNFELYNAVEEQALVRSLAQFPEVIKRVADTYKPHHLANYCTMLAQAFNEFYHKHHVISEMKNQMKARLLLVDCVRQVLESGLRLLGIHAPKEM